MNKQYIQFKKQRELGDVITDTFSFLRQEYKPLLQMIIKLVGPAFILLALAIGYYSYVTMGTFDSGLTVAISTENPAGIFVALFILLISVLIFMGMLYGTVLHFIKSYIEHDGMVVPEEVKQGTMNDFGSLIGLSLLIGIMLFFGFMLCVIPGIFLFVPLSFSFSILVFERKSISNAISASFDLVKDNWWMTFLSLVVIAILVYIISIVFSIPMIFYMFIKGFALSQEGSVANPEELFDWVYVLLSVFSSLVQYLLYTITTIALAFIYFNLREKKYFTGTYEAIDNLGSEKK